MAISYSPGPNSSSSWYSGHYFLAGFDQFSEDSPDSALPQASDLYFFSPTLEYKGYLEMWGVSIHEATLN